MAEKVLILPGTTSPTYEKYLSVYETIEVEAQNRGFQYYLVHYPGQPITSSDSPRTVGLLNYKTALESALLRCRQINPTWIIGLSTGCTIAAGLLALQDLSLQSCNGAVLWGAISWSVFRGSNVPEEIERTLQQEKNLYEQQKRAFLAPDFFQTMPCVTELVKLVPFNLRFACGSEDNSIVSASLLPCAQAHHQAQPERFTESVKIEALRHSVRRTECLSQRLNESFEKYLKCLFEPIGTGVFDHL